MTTPHILIAGAGIGGLTAATALAQKGAKVEIFEQAQALGDVGAGIQQGPNAMHVHAAIGTESAIIERGFEPEYGTFMDYKTGETEFSFALKAFHENRYGRKYIHIHRADLHAILVDAARNAGVEINLGQPAKTYLQNIQSVTLKTSSGTREADILIGADGIHSKIRETMFGVDKANFTGQVAWRATIPATVVPDDAIPKHANAWIGPGKHCVVYYVRGDTLINIVAIEEREDWAEESWNIKGDVAALRSAFAGWDKRLTELLSHIDDCYLWGLFDRAPLPKWVDGGVALLGDAAHPMLPSMAQGASMAIEDGWVLAHHIMAGSGDYSDRLKLYQSARYTRATKMQALSRDNANLYHLRSPAARAVRRLKFKLARFAPWALASRFDHTFGVDVTKDYPL